MRTPGRLAALVLALWATAAGAERVVLGLSQDEVLITATFDGSNLLIFGAIQREAPIPTDSALDVVVTLAGPERDVVVRRKERRWGLWVNAAQVTLRDAPSFYAVASTAPMADILSLDADLRHTITVPRVVSNLGSRAETPDTDRFSAAMVRLRERSDLFQSLEGAVILDENTLFRAEVTLPSNLVEGDYATRIFLLRNGDVIDRYQTLIEVRKVGLERFLYNLAQTQPIVYGVLSLVLAVAAGWLASAAFRLAQR